MSLLKQSTAFTRTFYLGATGLSPTVQISKAGAAFAAPASAIAALANGFYTLALTAGDVDTLGELTYAISDTSLFQQETDQVVPDLPGAVTLSPTDIDTIANGLLDEANGVETSLTLRQAMRLLTAALAGKLAIAGSTVTIRDINDTKNRITATTDANDERTAVTIDVS